MRIGQKEGGVVRVGKSGEIDRAVENDKKMTKMIDTAGGHYRIILESITVQLPSCTFNKRGHGQERGCEPSFC